MRNRTAAPFAREGDTIPPLAELLTNVLLLTTSVPGEPISIAPPRPVPPNMPCRQVVRSPSYSENAALHGEWTITGNAATKIAPLFENVLSVTLTVPGPLLKMPRRYLT
jgi:hypothetical protein